jgi:hypothetical protein
MPRPTSYYLKGVQLSMVTLKALSKGSLHMLVALDVGYVTPAPPTIVVPPEPPRPGTAIVT